MNGTAAPTAPAAPTTEVATVKNRRRPLSTGALLIHLSPVLDAVRKGPQHKYLILATKKMLPDNKEKPCSLQGNSQSGGNKKPSKSWVFESQNKRLSF